jgi:3-oxoacyl-[acyl-carrier protein] reductase
MFVLTGIGRAAASLLAQKGARIAISDVDAQVSEEACQELQKAGYEAASFPGDMLDEAFPQKLVDGVIQKWGKINCLINNAGMLAYHVA